MQKRSGLKVIASGNLIEINSSKTQDGKPFNIGRMISKAGEKTTELTFYCFDDKINKKLNSGNYFGERVKIQGKIQTRFEDNIEGQKETRLLAHVKSIEKARSLKDEARFIALGLIKKVQDCLNCTLCEIEAEAIYNSVCYRTSLEVVVVNPYLRKKVNRNRGQKALIKGKVENIFDEKYMKNKKRYRTVCIMESLNIVQNSVSR